MFRKTRSDHDSLRSSLLTLDSPQIPREVYFVHIGSVQVIDEQEHVIGVIRNDVPDMAPVVGEVSSPPANTSALVVLTRNNRFLFSSASTT